MKQKFVKKKWYLTLLLVFCLLLPMETFASKPNSDDSYIYKHIDVLDDFISHLTDEQKELFTDDYIYELINICNKNDLDIWLVLSVIETESSYDANAKAYDGSSHYGLMQLSTKYFECDDYFNAIENTTVGCEELKRLLVYASQTDFIQNSSIEDADILYALMCYNKGTSDATTLFNDNEITNYASVILDRAKYYNETYKKFNYEEVLTDKRISIAYIKVKNK